MVSQQAPDKAFLDESKKRQSFCVAQQCWADVLGRSTDGQDNGDIVRHLMGDREDLSEPFRTLKVSEMVKVAFHDQGARPFLGIARCVHKDPDSANTPLGNQVVAKGSRLIRVSHDVSLPASDWPAPGDEDRTISHSSPPIAQRTIIDERPAYCYRSGASVRGYTQSRCAAELELKSVSEPSANDAPIGCQDFVSTR
jgi:hypothetical protein